MRNPFKKATALAGGMVLAWVTWAIAAGEPVSHSKIEAATLQRTPQNAWARAILFSDVIETLPNQRSRRLDRKNYLSMRLKEAGTVWIPEQLAPQFRALEQGGTYSFAGTVDQISRRYYVIIDACYKVQTMTDMTERWIDMLHGDTRTEPSKAELSETALQALLLNAQNSLIKMAEANQMTVAQLIEAQADGGQRIAEHIVADALQGELRAQGKTADELMIGAVLSLLQKQAVLEESARAAKELEALESQPPIAEETAPELVEQIEEPELAVEETADTAPESAEEPLPQEVALVSEEDSVVEPDELPETPSLPPTPEAVATEPEAMATEPEAVLAELEIDAAEPEVADFSVEEEMALDELVTIEEEVEILTEALEESAPVAETDGPAIAPTELASGDLEVDIPPPAEEEAAAKAPPKIKSSKGKKIRKSSPKDTQIVLPPSMDDTMGEGMIAEEYPVPTPDSRLVVPLADGQPDVIPLVSTGPTKAEVAQAKRTEQLQLEEQQRQEKLEAQKQAEEAREQARLDKAAAKKQIAEERKAVRLQQQEAKKLAAEEKKAARLKLLEEKQTARLAEQEAAKKAAEEKQIARQMAAEAKKLEAEEKKAAAEARKAELALQETEALRAREAEAARKAAERKADQEAARAEAQAVAELKQKEEQLALQEKEALEALRQNERLAKLEADARARREASERRIAEYAARQAAAEEALAADEAQWQEELERMEAEAMAQAEAEAAEQAARLAEVKAQQEDALRMSREVAEHEQQAAEAARQRIADEEARRKELEQELARMKRGKAQVDVPAKTAPDEAPAAEPALSAKERRRLEAAARKEERKAAKEKTIEQPAADPGDLPEWLQPVIF